MAEDPSAAALDAASSLSLATVRPDGRPHVVPLWFVCDRGSFVVLSKPNAQKVRNLIGEPRAMVSIGNPGNGDTGLVEVVGQVEQGGGPEFSTSFESKYRDLLEAVGLTADGFVQTYPVAIRLRPTRWLAWGGPGWANGLEPTDNT